jgi:hypothetical protein
MQLQDLADLLRCSGASAREFLPQQPHLVLLVLVAGDRIQYFAVFEEAPPG